MLQKEGRRLASEALSEVGVVKGSETKRNKRESLRGVIKQEEKAEESKSERFRQEINKMNVKKKRSTSMEPGMQLKESKPI